jgi:hypothetical protein
MIPNKIATIFGKEILVEHIQETETDEDTFNDIDQE